LEAKVEALTLAKQKNSTQKKSPRHFDNMQEFYDVLVDAADEEFIDEFLSTTKRVFHANFNFFMMDQTICNRKIINMNTLLLYYCNL